MALWEGMLDLKGCNLGAWGIIIYSVCIYNKKYQESRLYVDILIDFKMSSPLTWFILCATYIFSMWLVAEDVNWHGVLHWYVIAMPM